MHGAFKKISRLRRERRGFTLVEISVSLILLLLVMSMSSSILIFTINMANRSARMNERKLTGDQMYHVLTQRLQNAVHIALQPGSTPSSGAKYENIIQVTDTTIQLGTRTGGFTQVYTPVGLNNAKMLLETQIVSDGVLQLSFTIKDEHRIEQYNTQSAVRLLNIYDKLSLRDKDTGAGLGLRIENLAGAEKKNLLISYEFAPVMVEETYGGDGPYTVDKQYKPPEGLEIKTFPQGTPYSTGDYIYGPDGKLYIATGETNASYPPGDDYMVSEWRCIEDGVWQGTSTYEKGDVVIGSDGNFYMCKQRIANMLWDPAGGWPWNGYHIQVYWCQEKADEYGEGGQLRGWSVASSDTYECALDVVQGAEPERADIASDTMIKNQSEID